MQRSRSSSCLLCIVLLAFGVLPAQAAPSLSTAPSLAAADPALLAKLDPRLVAELDAQQQAPQLAGGNAPSVLVDLIARRGAGAAAARLFEKSLLRPLPSLPLFDAQFKPGSAPVAPAIEIVSGRLRYDRLLKLASDPAVAQILKLGLEPPQRPAPSVTASAPAPRALGHVEQSHVDWRRAWAAGYTGKGVDVAVIDSGIDFAHPDLEGLQARVADPASPYFYQGTALAEGYGPARTSGIGLPIAFDATSALDYALDQRNDLGNWSFYLDTSRAVALPASGDSISVDGQSYQLPPGLRGGDVRLGWSSDNSLRYRSPTTRVALLLANTSRVDLDRNGQFDDFDTVYMDIDGDHNFADDKPAFLGDETLSADSDGDGLADLSGGMVYFIADGVHSIPALDWLYGSSLAENRRVPRKGDLVALMVDDPTDPGGQGHGTHCASTVVSKAVVGAGSAQNPRVDRSPGTGVVQAAARDAHLIAISNVYAGGSLLDMTMVALLGYDGKADGPDGDRDDAQLVNLSFGDGNSEVGSFQPLSRLLGVLNRFYNPYVLLAHAAGNSGPGAGTLAGPDPWTALTVAATAQAAGQQGSDPIFSLDQATFGDMAAFSNQGPDARGTAGIEIAASGEGASGAVPLNARASGADAWELWSGTSRATPAVLATLADAYQAWRARTGRWPSYSEARDLAMSAATYSFSTPSLGGAGISNAGRTALIAGGQRGLYAAPARWAAGGYAGSDWQEGDFVNLLRPGEAASKTFSLTNTSATTQAATLRALSMQEIGRPVQGQLTTADQAREQRIPGKPDYLVRLPAAQIPADADLLVVRSIHSNASFDPNGDQQPDSIWKLAVYDWTDQNGNGRLWSDANRDGAVDATDADGDGALEIGEPAELDVGEYNRFGRSDARGPAQEVRVGEPDRAHDGIFLGWEHSRASSSVPTTTLRYEVRFYQLQPWAWASLSTQNLAVPAATSNPGVASFNAQLRPPAGTPPGYYEGYLFVETPGSNPFLRFAQLVPDAPALDLYIDGQRSLAAADYLEISAYRSLTPGRHRIQLTPAGRSLRSALLDTTLDLAEGAQLTLAALGTLDSGDNAPLALRSFADEQVSSGGPEARLRVVNSIAGVGAVDVYMIGPATIGRVGAKIAANLAAGQAGAFFELAAGRYTLRAYRAGADPLATSSLARSDVVVEAGQVLDVYAAGTTRSADSLRLRPRLASNAPAFDPQRSAIPVTLNVAASASSSTGSLLGGQPRGTRPYDNNVLHGTINWAGQNVDDTRRFMIEANGSAGSYLVAHTSWSDAPPSDIDTLILGPLATSCSDLFASCDADLERLVQQTLGPSGFQIAGSSLRAGRKPRFRYATSGGASDDWALAALTPGLHQVLNDNVATSGAQLAMPFRSEVGVLQITPAAPALQGTEPLTLAVSTGITLPNGLQVAAFGPDLISSTLPLIWPEDDAGTTRIYSFTATHAGSIDLRAQGQGIDVDLLLSRDANGDGQFTPDEQVASALAPGTAEDRIRLALPQDGRYQLEISNALAAPGSAQLRVSIIQGSGISVERLPGGPLGAGRSVQLSLRRSTAGEGGAALLFVGPLLKPSASIEIPVTLSRQRD